MKRFVFILGRLLSYIFPWWLRNKVSAARNVFFTGYSSRSFKHFGKNCLLGVHTVYLGCEHISLGDNTAIGDYGRLTAYDYYEPTGSTFNPEIIIGNNCEIGSQSHITAIHKIHIGDNLLTGPRVLITDNAHGSGVREEADIAPKLRQLTHKGGVEIEDNVWIGEGTMIIGNVHIGRGAIIAANSVVTKDVPDYCTVAGVPARIVKQIDTIER